MSLPSLVRLPGAEAPHLIAIDMDGTLLGADHHVSVGNAAAIKRLQERGHQVVIATGRAERDARTLIGKAGLSCPIISSNGALTTDAAGRVWRTVPLPRASLDILLPKTADAGLYTELYTHGPTYILADSRAIMQADQEQHLGHEPSEKRALLWRHTEAHLAQNGLVAVSSFAPILSDPAQILLKLLTFTYAQEKLAALAQDFEGQESLAVTRSSPFNLEFSHHEAQKGIALRALAEVMGIAMTRTVAVGDNHNDLSMMRIAGHAVAMGGAEEVIQAACQSVTLRCEDDGVAYALTQLFG